MMFRRCLPAIALLMLGSIAVGCTQQTQLLYQIEMERSCQGCDLRGVNLAGQNLSDKYRISVANQPLSTQPEGLGYAEPVDLTGADLRHANFKSADLSEVILNATQLNQANLSEANLANAQLVEADLRRADLRGANLQGANFQNADLTGADLRETDLQAANLRGADLTDAWVDSAPL